MMQELATAQKALSDIRVIETGVIVATSAYLVDRIVVWIIKLRRSEKTNGKMASGSKRCFDDGRAVIACEQTTDTHRIVLETRDSISDLSHSIKSLNETAIRQEKILEKIAEKL